MKWGSTHLRCYEANICEARQLLLICRRNDCNCMRRIAARLASTDVAAKRVWLKIKELGFRGF